MDRDLRGSRNHYDPDVMHLGRGESYRPGAGAPAPRHRAAQTLGRGGRDTWTTDRRDSGRREETDSYVPYGRSRTDFPRSRSPSGYRGRSRSPPHKGRDGMYSGKPRSPGRPSPRHHERPRSPTRRRSRSSYRTRPLSPPLQRGRGISPPPPRRTSPRPHRERFSPHEARFRDRSRSPARSFRTPSIRVMEPRRPRNRSPTPPRRHERKEQYEDESWRRGLRSPKDITLASAAGGTSRRPPSPLHPDSMGHTRSQDRMAATGYSRVNDRGPVTSALPLNSSKSSNRNPPPQLSPTKHYVNRTRLSPSPPHDQHIGRRHESPSGPETFHLSKNGRVPPSGPATKNFEAAKALPPSGPSATSAVSPNAHRSNQAILAAPTRPRGTPSGRPESGSRGGADIANQPSSSRGSASRPTFHDIQEAPHGPRAGVMGATRGRADPDYGVGDLGHGKGDYTHGRNDSHKGRRLSPGREEGPRPRLHGNISSSTHPRTQRFNTKTHYLSVAEKIVPGGKLAPSVIPVEQERRFKQLEETAEKMREEIEEKQSRKREVLYEWDIRQRESEREGLRNRLAEQHLEKLTDGENGAGVAF